VLGLTVEIGARVGAEFCGEPPPIVVVRTYDDALNVCTSRSNLKETLGEPPFEVTLIDVRTGSSGGACPKDGCKHEIDRAVTIMEPNVDLDRVRVCIRFSHLAALTEISFFGTCEVVPVVRTVSCFVLSEISALLVHF
jgi:hypothetical protein